MPGEENAIPARRRRLLPAVAREAMVVALFVLLCVAMTWPLASNLSTAVSDPGDPYLNAWILHWDQVALFDGSKSLWNAPVFFPAKLSLAFSENLLGIALVTLPAHLAGASPLLVYNIAMLLGFVFAGWGAYVLGRVLTGSSAAGIVAGIFFAFVPYRFDHLAHLQHIWSGWLPIMVAALILVARRPSSWRGGLLAFAFVMNGLTNVHWMLFGSFSIAMGAVILALGRPRFVDRRYWGVVVSSVGLGVLVLIPAMLPYREASKVYGMKRSIGEVKFYSAEPADWFVAATRNKLWGKRTDPGRRHPERSLFPGVTVLLIAAAGLALARREDERPEAMRAIERPHADDVSPRVLRILRRIDVAIVIAFAWWLVELANDLELRDHARFSQLRQASLAWVLLLALVVARLIVRMPDWLDGPATIVGRLSRSRFSLETWLAISLVVVGVIGSLGLHSFLHEFLFGFFDVFRAIRVPARWSMIAYLGLAMLLARATVAFASRARRLAPLVAVVFSVALLAETNAAPIRWYIAPADPAPVYTWLADAPFSSAVLELPIGHGFFASTGTGGGEFEAMLGAATHDRPLVNGFSGFVPPEYYRVARFATADPVAPQLIKELERIGCGLIVVHNDRRDASDALRVWLREGVASGRLAFVRRFDHGVGGDWVFALTSVERDLAALREPEDLDPSGRTPLENAAVFLESNEPTYNRDTFGWLDVPHYNDTLRGDAVVAGWAFSPWGIREVRVRLENGRVIVPAELTDRGDVRAGTYPWYPETTREGFRARFPNRPAGVRRETDLQVEIVDGRDRTTRLPVLYLEWRFAKPLPEIPWDGEALDALIRRFGADPAEWHPRFDRGEASLRDVASVLLDMTRDDDDAAFVRRAFELALGRDVDSASLGRYVGLLGHGYSRADAVDEILSSDEFRKRHGR